MSWFSRAEGRAERPVRGNKKRQALRPAAIQRAEAQANGLQPGDAGYPAPTNGERPTRLTGRYNQARTPGATRVVPSQVDRQAAEGKYNEPLRGNHRQRRDAARRAAQPRGQEAVGRAAAAQRRAARATDAQQGNGGLFGFFSGLLAGSPDAARAAAQTAQQVAKHPKVRKLAGVAVKSAQTHDTGDRSVDGIIDLGLHILTDGVHSLATEDNQARTAAAGRRPGRQARGARAKSRANDQVTMELHWGAQGAGDRAVAEAQKAGVTNRKRLAQIRRKAVYEFGREVAAGVPARREKLTHKHAHSTGAHVTEAVTNAPHRVRASIWGRLRQRGIDSERDGAHARIKGRSGRNQTPQGKAGNR